MATVKINSGSGNRVTINKPGGSASVRINYIEAIPDAPTNGVVDNTNDTFDWTNNPLFTSISDYEYSLNGAAYTGVTVKPIVVGNINVEIGSLLVRVKSMNGNPSSSALSNSSVFEVNPKVTPAAPVIVSENNITNQIHFQAPSGYKASDCQYKIQGGSAINATSTVIEIGDVALSIGNVEIYVKAGTGRNQSSSIFSTTAFTQSVILTTVTSHSNTAADFYTGGTNGMFLNVAANSKIATTGTATRVEFKLSAAPDLAFFWLYVYRKDGATYDLVNIWQQVPIGDLIVGVNEMYIPSAWNIQAGDYVGFTISGNSGFVAMFPRTDDTSPGTNDIMRAATISAVSDKDFDGGTGFETGFYPIILKT